ncbi:MULTISPECIES: TetR/AcrR family transcriptional regulator [Nocardia]|uniref:TetR/AcrR family transcriptional regulator n=1 Tax=Nocardia aurea TaxID=2144174 RepID=A0ABV3FSL6_9NOCA|nr:MULTISPECIES: TetR/AcrR family transcriptional regulator [Nocardia]
MTATRRGRPTRTEAEQLDERLRRAAVATFLSHGYDGTTMEAVARAAEVTKRTLYARYPDKHALFVSVIPWALSRLESAETDTEFDGEDLAGALTAIGRAAIARAVDPDSSQLVRIALTESARFPEFGISRESMLWSAQQRAVMAVLREHERRTGARLDDVELAAEQFIAMVALVPGRMADFGILRAPEEEERHLRHAVTLFLNGILPR